MAADMTYQLRPSRPFTAHYALTVADSFMVQMDSAYLYILSAHLTDSEKSGLESILAQSLATFFEAPEPSAYNLPELLGTIYEDASTGYLTVKVSTSSSVPFIVKERSSQARFCDLKPEHGFPLRPLKPSIFGPSVTAPPPDATEGVGALWVQLTYTEGGFVIHLHIHHWIAGASSAARLVEAWFERARLMATSANMKSDLHMDLSSVFSKCTIQFGHRQQLTDTLAAVTAPQLSHPDILHVPGGRRVWAGMDFPPIVLLILLNVFTFCMTYLSFLLPQSDVQIFHFSPESLERLRRDVRDAADGPEQIKGDELTANDCLTALLWRSMSRARFPPPSVPDSKSLASISTLLTAVDYRSRVQPPLHANFFGNASMDVYTELPMSSLVGAVDTASRQMSTTSYIAAQIHRSVKGTTDSYIRSFYQLISSRPRILDTRHRPIRFQYGTDVLCTSWEHIHADAGLLRLELPESAVSKNKIKFETVRYMHSEGLDGAIVVLPAFGQKWKAQDAGNNGQPGGLQVAISLTRKSMDILKRDEDFKRYATWGEAGGYITSRA
ncbi:hypothetical protein LTR10_020338 [Elasticomyces elasticus]|uniref:Condensation domain-containing protein n=1 Tax=Exophiala sideris TaxID=1016849 RepID=A0ABR0J9M3_9EURO|nr:hypothetical protein LTR10_020338 [Elasticomyces elasticus]KAK5022802.1 hypothetical protein LTS07_009780 [Exophiala sideris]KAK5026704.1 hypothetical protein LTR13_009928 [Exophiala sideris]KAK5059429.1 hypothetical protein LTR69_006018 [Exophiala sideris]KAK5177427.1 hypothetical protein LTR44_010042 [Eurotiomycetes sp. CCFEE 6388]